ncbi:bifunctional ADP-dependent (S)-NAD(P)H-hydrate dehydratase/NAD(P)H-hydrate epimerase [Chromobacterium sphagni]|uniref:Bifunctional NAD(P)H-hydrate repair enzyme n=1 Tax=Chromobacterium sphagni TaxID=1903179 RepID=A0A1S1X181_9NEIS|nr:bifunctional ADP-dependent NAD(P)H-hydrate dehydratase/NAD(P)H-hydrate epimerase [Chromobacterium sphagni]OHX13282.1 bifunctional ADP-dependent (S)-NAD(P)H-hydrate dehydratase/NAD(P)H-hydrate epimerase [Chromobacterium sphagni]
MKPSPILSLEALRQLERTADAAGLMLMQRAAQASADWVGRHLAPGSRLLVCAGPGNNGGDALYAALELQQREYLVDVLLPCPPSSLACRQALQQAQASELAIFDALPAHYPPPALLIDGLFGIGLSRPLDETWKQRINQLNALDCPILALDCPSGLDAYSGQSLGAAIHADHTLTFLCYKPGLFCSQGADLAGQVELATLDCPPHFFPPGEGALNAPCAAALARPRDSHKGSFGTVAVIGGAPGMLGAALLAGRSALQGGAGKVYLCPLDDRLPVDAIAPELMIRPLDEMAELPAADVIAFGPGLGQQELAARLLPQIVALPLPLVLDADALNMLAGDRDAAGRIAQRSSVTVLTPHPAEAARLLQIDTAAVQRDRIAHARQLAARYRCVVVLKGAGSLIVRPDGYYLLNTSGGPELAAAGQGDVLTGLIAALLAQGLPAFDATALAVHLHGLAGDDYQQESGGPIGLTASATAIRISRVLNRLLAGR